MDYNKVDLEKLKIAKNFGTKNLQINPFFIKISGSIVGGYLLSQLWYLFNEVYDWKEFYHKDVYLREKLHLSEWELRSQKKELVKRQLINIRQGKGNITYYSVNIQKLIDLASVDNNTELKLRNEESSDLETRNPRIQKRGILGTHIRKKDPKTKIPKTDPKNLLINGDVDKIIAPIGAVPNESANNSVSYLQIELSEIQNIKLATIKEILTYPEYIVIDVLRTYRKNANRVREVNRYLLVAIRQRGQQENVVKANHLRINKQEQK